VLYRSGFRPAGVRPSAEPELVACHVLVTPESVLRGCRRRMVVACRTKLWRKRSPAVRAVAPVAVTLAGRSAGGGCAGRLSQASRAWPERCSHRAHIGDASRPASRVVMAGHRRSVDARSRRAPWPTRPSGVHPSCARASRRASGVGGGDDGQVIGQVANSSYQTPAASASAPACGRCGPGPPGRRRPCGREDEVPAGFGIRPTSRA